MTIQISLTGAVALAMIAMVSQLVRLLLKKKK